MVNHNNISAAKIRKISILKTNKNSEVELRYFNLLY